MANLSSKTGFTPVQTSVALTLSGTTSVQDFAAYDAQELTGFVQVLGSTNYRTSVKVMVVKNGAGTYEVASVDLAGDNYSSAPLVSFAMSGSILRATLPSITGATSAKIQYQLNAPALGGQFPLTVSASQVQGRTSGTVSSGYIGEKITWVTAPGNQNLTTSASFSDWTNNTITLSAGTWLVFANLSTGAQIISGNARVEMQITNSSNTVVENQNKEISWGNTTATATTYSGVIPFSFITSTNTALSLKVRVKATLTGTTALTVYNQPGFYSEFFAVRIA